MQIEWEPDADNVYLTSAGHDNLALHRAPNSAESDKPAGFLDHIGIVVRSAGEVDQWYAWIQKHGAPVLREIKTHRDGARSFYIADPDGVVIQVIHHPPIAEANAKLAGG